MKNLLKIDNKVRMFRDDKDEYKVITTITREDVLYLLDTILEHDTTMDDPKLDTIANDAERLIYEDLYEQFNEFIVEKPSLKEEVDSLFKEKLSTYQ